jgi:hypothetical protein
LKRQTFELPDRTHTVVEWFGEEATPKKGLVVFLPALGASIDSYRSMATVWAAGRHR